MKTYEKLKPWYLQIDLNNFTLKRIGPQTNIILLITWAQTTSQEVLKFSIIEPKIFLPRLLV
jgi:hypothetical protein